MTYDEVLTHFGPTQNDVARKLGITQGAVSYWRRTGKIPDSRQYILAGLSNGALKVDPELIPPELRP